MTPRSPSRGMLYSAPPRGTDDEKPENEDVSAEVEPADVTEATANWTGAVPADD